MKDYTTIEQRLDNALATQEKELARLSEAIRTATEIRDNAVAAMQSAYAAADPEAYAAAQNDKSHAESVIEMMTRKKAEAESASLISDEEAKEIMKEILAHYSECDSQLWKRLLAVQKELQRIGEEFEADAAVADRVVAKVNRAANTGTDYSKKARRNYRVREAVRAALRWRDYVPAGTFWDRAGRGTSAPGDYTIEEAE